MSTKQNPTYQAKEYFTDIGVGEVELPKDPDTVVISQFLNTVYPNLISFGWVNDTAKSAEYFDNWDQPMHSHVFYGIQSIIQFNSAVDAEYRLDKSELRKVIGMWTVHDYHKRDPQLSGEFDVPVSEAKNIMSNLDLDEFCPNLAPEDYHSAIVGLHRFADHGKFGSLSETFLEYQSHLRLMDALASTTSPSDIGDSILKLATSATDWDHRLYTHTLSENRGMLSTLINRAVSKHLSDKYEWTPMDVFDTGVVYLSSSESDISIDINSIVEDVIGGIRDTVSGYRTDYSLTDAIDGGKFGRSCDISLLDAVCLSNEELLSAIVQSGFKRAERLNSATDTDCGHLERLESVCSDVGLNIELERTARMSGLAQTVETILSSVAPEIVVSEDVDNVPPSQKHSLGVTISAFGVSPECQRQIADLLTYIDEHDSAVNGVRSTHIKYLIAQDIIEREFDGRRNPREICSSVISTLSENLQAENPNWGDFFEMEVEEVKTELRRHILKTVSLNGDPLHTYTDIDPLGAEVQVDSKVSCCVCGEPTLQDTDRLNPFPLIAGNKEVEEERLQHTVSANETAAANGTITLERLGERSGTTFCANCQIDIRLRSERQEWGDNSTVAVELLGKYNSFCWEIFDSVFSHLLTRIRDSGLRLNPSRFKLGDILEFVSPFSPSGDRTTKSYTVADAFHVSSGIGGHARLISCSDTPDERAKVLYAVLTSAALSGVHVRVGENPRIGHSFESQDPLITTGDKYMSSPLFSHSANFDSAREMSEVARCYINLNRHSSHEAPLPEIVSDLLEQEAFPGTYLFHDICSDFPDTDTHLEVTTVADQAAYIDACSDVDPIVRDLGAAAKRLGRCVSESTDTSIRNKWDMTAVILAESLIESQPTDVFKRSCRERISKLSLEPETLDDVNPVIKSIGVEIQAEFRELSMPLSGVSFQTLCECAAVGLISCESKSETNEDAK